MIGSAAHACIEITDVDGSTVVIAASAGTAYAAVVTALAKVGRLYRPELDAAVVDLTRLGSLISAAFALPDHDGDASMVEAGASGSAGP